MYKKMWISLMRKIANRAESTEKIMQFNTETYFHILAEMARIQHEYLGGRNDER